MRSASLPTRGSATRSPMPSVPATRARGVCVHAGDARVGNGREAADGRNEGRATMKIAIKGMRLVNGTNERGLTRGAAMAKANRIAKQRAAGCHNVIAHAGGISKARAMLPVIVTIVRIAPRKLDLGNLWASVKPVQDGIADAFGVDDREGGPITWRVAQRKGGVREYGCEVLIEPREDGTITGLRPDVDAWCEVNQDNVPMIAIDKDHEPLAFWVCNAQQLRAFIVQCEAALAEMMERER